MFSFSELFSRALLSMFVSVMKYAMCAVLCSFAEVLSHLNPGCQRSPARNHHRPSSLQLLGMQARPGGGVGKPRTPGKGVYPSSRTIVVHCSDLMQELMNT